MNPCVIATSRSWFRQHTKLQEQSTFDFTFVESRSDLTLATLQRVQPRFVFFPHWNWKVDASILAAYECIAFHTAPLPEGRGGSPIQNLILRKHRSAPVCALRMTEVIDGGPVYLSEEVSLEGRLADIQIRIAAAVDRMILRICATEPTPNALVGEPKHFARLTEEDNRLRPHHTMEELHDHIRMVDGPGYLPAYLDFGPYRLSFTSSQLQEDALDAHVRIARRGD